jgi:hypothetical protein
VADQADDSIRPPQPFMQPFLPCLSWPDAVVEITIKKDRMSRVHKPVVNCHSEREIRSGVADKDSRHLDLSSALG